MIGCVVERDDRVEIYDENNSYRSSIPLGSSDDSLAGYTSTRVSIKRSDRIEIYDEDGHYVDSRY